MGAAHRRAAASFRRGRAGLVGRSPSRSPPSPQRCDPATGEPLFTLDQVQNIVRHAVDQKEAQLREQYDHVLQGKLQEQYACFAKFNEDYRRAAQSKSATCRTSFRASFVASAPPPRCVCYFSPPLGAGRSC